MWYHRVYVHICCPCIPVCFHLLLNRAIAFKPFSHLPCFWTLVTLLDLCLLCYAPLEWRVSFGCPVVADLPLSFWFLKLCSWPAWLLCEWLHWASKLPFTRGDMYLILHHCLPWELINCPLSVFPLWIFLTSWYWSTFVDWIIAACHFVTDIFFYLLSYEGQWIICNHLGDPLTHPPLALNVQFISFTVKFMVRRKINSDNVYLISWRHWWGFKSYNINSSVQLFCIVLWLTMQPMAIVYGAVEV